VYPTGTLPQWNCADNVIGDRVYNTHIQGDLIGDVNSISRRCKRYGVGTILPSDALLAWINEILRIDISILAIVDNVLRIPSSLARLGTVG
jgi:hypothetical protein